MSDWHEITRWLESVADQAEASLLGLAEQLDAQLEPWTQAAEQVGKDVADQLDATVSPWIDAWVDAVVQPILDTPLDIEFDLDEAIDAVVQPWRQTVMPPLDQHPVCAGCKHYHGESYGGHFLVCGMYPYGLASDQTTCPEKESIDWQEPWKTWFDQIEQTWTAPAADAEQDTE